MPKPSVTKSGTKKLSEVARHLVVPAGIVTSAWPSVRSQCAALGITFEAWQEGIGRVAFAKGADGIYSAAVGGVVMSIPRQVGKTYLVGGMAFAVCLLTPKSKVIWTAHHSNTADETFESMSAMAQMRKIAPHVRTVRSTNGQQRIYFRNGSRIEFGARERGFGRGKQKVSFLVLDEAQILTDSALENMVPSMNRAANPLMFMMGTPPREQDPGEMFKNKRARALSGASKNVFFLEISADEDADLDDHSQWAIANPSFPHFTPVEAMLRMRENFTDDGFRREALGIWDDPDKSGWIIPRRAWSDALAKLDATLSNPVISVDMRTGVSQSLSIAVASFRDDGTDNVKIARYERGADEQWARDFALESVQEIMGQLGVQSVAIDQFGEGNGLLISRFEAAGVSVVKLNSQDMRNGTVGIIDGFLNGRVVHHNDQPLTEAVSGARTRKRGEGFVWDQAKSAGDITALRAATAAWWVLQSLPRDYDPLAAFQ